MSVGARLYRYLICYLFAGGESSTYQATRLCKTANVVVISASYRLAPENRLPTAFNDAYITMSWLQKQVIKLPNNVDLVFLTFDNLSSIECIMLFESAVLALLGLAIV